MLKQLVAAIMGGILVAIGGCVYLNSLGSAQLYIDMAVGAVFLTAAFVVIAMKGYGLFTDRVGELPDRFTGNEAAGLGMTLLGNAIGAILVGALVALTMEGGIGAVASSIAAAKIVAPWYATLLRAVLCGVLMHVGFSVYKEKESLLGILLCVPAFLLAGLDHAVVDMFCLAAAGFVGGLKGVGLLLLVTVGNAVGGMLFPLLSRLMTDTPKEEEGEAEDEPYESMFGEDEEEEATGEEGAPEVEA